jgi:prophage DNA circulation protein
MRDTPYLEDLGEDRRTFTVTAYLASDTADTDAGTLITTCALTGPGVLVLPTHGPLLVRCLKFKRSRSKDKHGYIAFDLHFIRDGASSPLVSVAMLANLVFAAADQTAAVIASAFVAGAQIAQQAGFVVDTAVTGTQDAISTLEAIRASQLVDPAVSIQQSLSLQSQFNAVPDAITDPTQILTVPTQIIASARALGDAMPATSAVPAFEAVVTDTSLQVTLASSYPTVNLQTAASNDQQAKRMLLLAALTAYCEAIARLTLTDRPSAITLRANVSEYIDGILGGFLPSDIAVYDAIIALRDATVNYLSRAIIDLAPIVTVEANLSMPSLYWAWRLYKDPTRSTDLVARNKVVDPSAMPTTFEALAS